MDGATLDWLFSEENGMRVWRKNKDGTYLELAVGSCGQSTCYKSIGEQRRRVREACSSSFSDKDIREFLGRA